MYAGRAQQNAHHEHIFEVAGDAGHQRLIHLCAQEGGVIYRQPQRRARRQHHLHGNMAA